MEKQIIRKTLIVKYFGSLKCPECGHQHYNRVETKTHILNGELKCNMCPNIIKFEIIDKMDEIFDPILYVKLK